MTGSESASKRTLVLMGLALAIALWSAFLWRELMVSRLSGADPFCAFGDPGACGELWDAPFASWIHRWTGVPVAGWGMIWGLAALVISAAVYFRKTEPGALKWISYGGLLALVALVGASAMAGLFCSSCFLVYLLTAAFAGVALTGYGGAMGSGGKAVALEALLGAFLLALYPGLMTPKSAASESQRALQAAAEAGGEAGSGASAATGRAVSAGSSAGLPRRFTEGPGTGDEARDRQLATLIESLSPQLRQGMSDLLVAFDGAPSFPESPARALEGPTGAPVRIVEFTDTLCSHCATLFDSLHQLREIAPEGSFSVDQRHYPLDGHCNRFLPIRGPETLRCRAARAKICMENRKGAQEMVRELYQAQEDLTEDLFWKITGEYLSRLELENCLADPATDRKLREDIELAGRYQPRGTPLVIVNGKEASAFMPFLYALVLNKGSISHPAFAALPPPST